MTRVEEAIAQAFARPPGAEKKRAGKGSTGTSSPWSGPCHQRHRFAAIGRPEWVTPDCARAASSSPVLICRIYFGHMARFESWVELS